MMKDRRALVFTILLHDVELSDPYNGFPYISVANARPASVPATTTAAS